MKHITFTAIFADGHAQTLGTSVYVDDFPDVESDATAQARAILMGHPEYVAMELAGDAFGFLRVSAKHGEEH